MPPPRNRSDSVYQLRTLNRQCFGEIYQDVGNTKKEILKRFLVLDKHTKGRKAQDVLLIGIAKKSLQQNLHMYFNLDIHSGL